MDQKTIELIHRDIDGLASPEEQRELALLLESSEDARDEHARMRTLCALLDGATSADPPPGLRDAILARIPVASVASVASVARPAASHRLSWGPSGRGARRSRRSRLGLAAALAATVGGVALLLFRAPDFQQFDPASLAGTIGQPAPGTASLQLEGEPLAGTVLLQRHTHGFTIEIAMNTSRPIGLVAGATEGPLMLQGLLPLGGQPAGLAEDAGRIHVLHSGRQHYSLVVTPGLSGASTIELSFYDGDALIREDRLVLPAGKGPERN
jgi:hypothetical protein